MFFIYLWNLLHESIAELLGIDYDELDKLEKNNEPVN